MPSLGQTQARNLVYILGKVGAHWASWGQLGSIFGQIEGNIVFP